LILENSVRIPSSFTGYNSTNGDEKEKFTTGVKMATPGKEDIFEASILLLKVLPN